MGPIGLPEIIGIGVILILLFGVGKISGLGRDLGTSIKEFRRAVREDDDKEKTGQQPPVQQAQQYAPPAPPPQPQYTPPQQPQPPQGEQKNPNIF